MNEYLIIELSNNIKYTMVDMIEYQEHKYVLLSQTSDDETNISDQLDICRYDDIENDIDKIEDEEEYNVVKNMFDERIKKRQLELSILHQFEIENLIELKVENIEDYNYTLKHNEDTYNKNIEFNTNTKPEVGDIIYINQNALNGDMLTYGYINSLSDINDNNILILERDEGKIYFQRYYG